MTDFRKNIRERFKQEVQPQYNDAKWDSFVNYQSIQSQSKSRRRILLLLLSGLGLIGAFTIYSWSTKEIPILLSDTTSTPIRSNTPSNAIVTDEITNSPASINADAASLIIPKNVSHKLSNANALTTMNNEAATSNSQKKIPPFTLNTDLNEIASDSPLSSGEISNKYVTMSPLKTLLTPIQSAITHPNIFVNKFYPKEIVIPANHRFMLYAYSGIAFPSHIKTSNEQAFQLGLLLKYQIHPKIRLKTGFEFGSIFFVSSEMNPRIGISAIPAPNDIVSFSNAVVNSTNLNFDLGFDYTFFEWRRWKPWLGFSYRISKELYKEIDYSFEEEDNNSNEEIHEYRSNENLYFIPNILHMESGISYETPFMGVNFSVGYPFQVKTKKVELIRQIQINLGVSKNF